MTQHKIFFSLETDDIQESVETSEMFKPGWKDIFRMNQTELESEIRKVSRDATLDPRRKAYLIQNLMTRFVQRHSDSLTLNMLFFLSIL